MPEQSDQTHETVGVETRPCVAGTTAGLSCQLVNGHDGDHDFDGRAPAPAPAETPYADAVEEYLEAADWLGPADAPLKVHARSIAKSLDKQLAERGEVQSALASSFDKVLYRLDARRPPARPPAPGLNDDDGDGTPSMFGFLSD